MIYQIPEKYYYRIHHCRPRFKGDIENVLIYVATEIAKIPPLEKSRFADRVNHAISLFPGNATKTEKTINNWRTEISSLFGYIQYDASGSRSKPGRVAMGLAQDQDLVKAFKVFLYKFQYPGGHLRSDELADFVQNKIRFHPAQFIIKLLDYAETEEGARCFITKAEATHCIFNDLRVTQGAETHKETWSRIIKNRENGDEYDWGGDTIRYAGDILDYMEIANLLVSHGGKFFLNRLEETTIQAFKSSDIFCHIYDSFYDLPVVLVEDIEGLRPAWFDYTNEESSAVLDTDILALIAQNEDEYKELKQSIDDSFLESLDAEKIKTKDIGDFGENLVHGHECMRLKLGNRKDLIHLVKVIPNQFSVGYDISSVELDEKKRCIEVKTTISSRSLDFTKFHLTTNEWHAAETFKDSYFVYRLFVSKNMTRLIVLKDPVGLYKGDLVSIVPRDGVDISFNPKSCGEETILLRWEN